MTPPTEKQKKTKLQPTNQPNPLPILKKNTFFTLFHVQLRKTHVYTVYMEYVNLKTGSEFQP